ncbi:hypothetical protein LXL04_007224 [Taraxacum kok-saghyz]
MAEEHHMYDDVMDDDQMEKDDYYGNEHHTDDAFSSDFDSDWDGEVNKQNQIDTKTTRSRGLTKMANMRKNEKSCANLTYQQFNIGWDETEILEPWQSGGGYGRLEVGFEEE